MKKIYIENLSMIVTNKCNLNCKHCLRGQCQNNVMSDEVIEKTLSQVIAINNLAICGGEPTLATKQIEKIFSYVIENKIKVNVVSIIINGTRYDTEFIKLLDYIEEYIAKDFKNGIGSFFAISNDKYHKEEIEKLKLSKVYLDNIEKYKESDHFAGLRDLNGKLIREGNAEMLDNSLTVSMKPMNKIITYEDIYMHLNKKNGLCMVGPIVTIDPEGIITESDVSIEHQQTIYNYGNVLTDSIEDVYLERATIVKPKIWKKTYENELTNYYKMTH